MQQFQISFNISIGGWTTTNIWWSIFKYQKLISSVYLTTTNVGKKIWHNICNAFITIAKNSFFLKNLFLENLNDICDDYITTTRCLMNPHFNIFFNILFWDFIMLFGPKMHLLWLKVIVCISFFFNNYELVDKRN